mmetsp:Transcript_4101/g.13150  ORF Transcript_4101/g.13150 Transcript_4101/m.13150 type:complete len:141 (-) Transcript_4101:375-797(-)
MPSPFPKMAWSAFDGGHQYDGKGTVTVEIDGTPEYVSMDPVKGPKVLNWDGSFSSSSMMVPWGAGDYRPTYKNWSEMSTTEQETALYKVAKMNRGKRTLHEARAHGDMKYIPESDKVATPLRIQKKDAKMAYYQRNCSGF